MPARAAHRAACRLTHRLLAWTAFRHALNLASLMGTAPAAQQTLAALSAARSWQCGSPDETNTSPENNHPNADRLCIALSRLTGLFRGRGMKRQRKGPPVNADTNTRMQCTKQRNKHHAAVKVSTNRTRGTKRMRLNLLVVAACSSSWEEPSSGAWGVAPQI